MKRMKRRIAVTSIIFTAFATIVACSTRSESPEVPSPGLQNTAAESTPEIAGLWIESPEKRAAVIGVGVPFCRTHMSEGSDVPSMGIYEIFPDGSFYQMLLLPNGDDGNQVISYLGIRTQITNGLAKFYIGKIRRDGLLDFVPEAAVLLDSKGGPMTQFVRSSLQGQIRVVQQHDGRLYFASVESENEEQNQVVFATTRHMQGLARIEPHQMTQYRMQIQLCRESRPSRPSSSPKKKG